MNHILKTSAMLVPLVVPAFLTACVSQSDYDALHAQNQQLMAQNQQLQSQLQQNQQQASAHIERLRGAIAYEINSDLLFRSGSWELSKEGQDSIANAARRLGPGQTVPLIVNGYTDNTPVGGALKRQGVTTNDELSQKRAEAVMQAMVASGVKADMVTAQGHGENDPVASNDSKDGRSANRRVVITWGASG
jgi:chemotaxis protein MotB